MSDENPNLEAEIQNATAIVNRACETIKLNLANLNEYKAQCASRLRTILSEVNAQKENLNRATKMTNIGAKECMDALNSMSDKLQRVINMLN